MTPKQKYEERRRLKAERLLREEEAKHDLPHRDYVEERMIRLMDSFERIADVLELWADKQGDEA